MKTYINYCGKQHSGKTTTLGIVIETLRKQAFSRVIFEKKSNPKKGNPPDYRIVFEITFNNQVHIVAISTYGDNLYNLFINHLLFDKYSPHVMITASHAHEDHGHNLFIDNYVYNEVKATNEVIKNQIEKREHFNYIKLQSTFYKDDDKISQQNKIVADVIYNMILQTLNL